MFNIRALFYHPESMDSGASEVHATLVKKKSWTWIKSFQYIKIINKILLQYYYHIFGWSFGYGIFKRENQSLDEPEFCTSFRRQERGI